jgi:protocatechuate 3,4-dioxygenase beta subunit
VTRQIGRDNPTIDAGIKPAYGSIGDYVWSDNNNDGQQTVGELPLSGVKVYLYNGAGTVKLDSTFTDINGLYTFDSLSTGAYKVKFVAPSGSIASKQNIGNDLSDSDANKFGFSQVVNINTALLPSDTLRNNPQIDAGFVPVGSVGDYVFNDTNGDGIQNTGDTPIAGLRVYLYNGAGTVKLDSTFTDINGKYLFDSLLAGTYKVKFVIPTGSEATTKGAGADTTKDSNINLDGTTDAVIIDTTLPVGNIGRDNPTIDAGIKPAYGSIGDYVWSDNNNDGQQTVGELPLSGVKVYLYNGAGTVKLDSTFTDINGLYTFDSLSTGAYKVKFVAPSGSIASKQNIGNDLSDSDANKFGFSQVVNINTSLLPVDTLRNNPQIDAGFVPVGSVGDYVFKDKDNSNTQTPGDTPVAGVKVYLLNGVGAKIDSTVTDTNGKYLFDGLVAGTYSVQFVKPAGVDFVSQNVGAESTDSDANPTTGKSDSVVIDTTKPIGDPARNNRDIDAGVKIVYGSIGDFVWSDVNNDGIQVPSELPIPGVKVYLYNGAGTVKLDSAITDVNGKYLFDSLVTGSYKVKFVAPVGTIPSKQNIGNDLTDSDANKFGWSHIVNINTALLTSDTLRNNPNVDAGFVPVGSLGDYVWFDINKDGLQTTGEPAVSGVKVYLLDGITGIKLDSIVTNALGKYLFDSLLSGSYKVQFVAPKDTTFTLKGATASSGLDSNPNPSTGLTDAVTIDASFPLGNAARDNRSVDAGFTVNLGSISGKTFDDNNNDGIQDAGDNPHSFVSVYLYKENTPGVYILVDSVITDSQGNYMFNNLTSGNYQIQFNKPSGSTYTIPNVGDDTEDSDVNSVDGRIIIKIDTNLPEIASGRNSKYNDAGFIPKNPICKDNICIPFDIKKVLK